MEVVTVTDPPGAPEQIQPPSLAEDRVPTNAALATVTTSALIAPPHPCRVRGERARETSDRDDDSAH